MVAGLTLLPTLLTIFGRRGFWPRRAIVAYDPQHPSVGGQGPWRRFGDWVLKRPVAALITTVALFIAGAFGLLAYKVDYSTTSFFKHSVEAVEGFDVLESSFPAGTLAPTTVLVESESGPVTPADISEVENRLRGVNGVATATDTGVRSTNGQIGEVDAVLSSDPLDKSGLNVVPRMRDAVSGPARRGHGPGWRDKRHQLRRRPGEPAGHRDHRPPGARGDGGDPGDPAPGVGRTAGPARSAWSSRSPARWGSRS